MKDFAVHTADGATFRQVGTATDHWQSQCPQQNVGGRRACLSDAAVQKMADYWIYVADYRYVKATDTRCGLRRFCLAFCLSFVLFSGKL